MPTRPTDDPLANGDRTVGVHGYRVEAIELLKREALLFDQIVVPGLDLQLINTPDDLFWLRDIGIVRDTVPIVARTIQGLFGTPRDLDDLVVHIGKPIGRMMTLPRSNQA